jgi:hypothetical protein
MIDKTKEIAFRVDTSLTFDDPHLIEVLEHLGPKLVNDSSDFGLEVLAHLFQHEHVFSKEQTHQSRVHQLVVSHEVVA